jgi:hypothetical protein
MRIRISSVVGLCFAVLFSFVLALNVVAKDKAPKMSNIQGRVQMIDKDSSTITVEKGSVRRQVVYSADTKFLYGHSKDNKPGSADQVKTGNYISCGGTFNGTKLTAKECVYRESK